MPTINPQEAKAEAWYRGRQDLILSPAQRKIQSTYDANLSSTIVVECSRQLGKTFWACFLADKVARLNKGCQIRLGTAFQVDIETIIVPNFKNVHDSCPESMKPKYNSAKATYTYDNGAQVVLVGLDKNPDKLRGNRILLAIIEEAGFVDSDTLHYVLDSVIAGAQLREPNARTVLISTPPEQGQDHHFCTVADQMELIGSYIKITIDESGLPQSQIDAFADKLGGRNSIAFRREALCERIVDTNRAIIGTWKDEYVKVIEKDEYYDYYHKYVGMDMGVSDLTAVLYGYYDFKRASLIIEDEYSINGPSINTDMLAKTIKAKEIELWGEKPPFRRVADNNWPILIADMSYLHNMPFIAVQKDEKHAMINELKILIDAGRIIVNPKCKQLLGCLNTGIWDKQRKAFARSKAYGHYDALDALIYLTRHIAQNTNPIPSGHGFTNDRAWVGNIKNKDKSKNANTIKNMLVPKRKRT